MAQSPDIATDIKEHVTPDELFGPMSPGGNHGYNDDDREKYKESGDVFRNTGTMSEQEIRNSQCLPTGHNLSSPINNSETFLTSNSRREPSTKEGEANEDAPYTDKSADADYGGTRSNQYSDTRSKDSRNSFKVSSMTVNRENVDKIRSRLHGGYNSQNGFTSRSSYHHVNIFDDALNISDSKLDNALLRLFSKNSNLIGHYSEFDNPIGSRNFSHSDFIGLEPVMWRVYPMNAAHKETLDREMDFIAFHVKPREIIGRLHKDGILTSLDYNQLTRTTGQGDRAVTRLMIRTLQRRGAKAYPALINALLASDYFLVCERLSESEHELKSGVLTDRAGWDWRHMKDGVHITPNRLHTPYMGTSSSYAYNWSSFPNHTMFSPNQNFPANETWPQANQRSLIDHVSPLYNTMPANHLVTPEGLSGRDSQMMRTVPLEQRLNHVDASLKIIHQDIAALRNDSRAHHNSRTLSRDADTHVSTNSPLRQTTSLGHQEIFHERLQQQMNDLNAKMKTVHEDLATLKGRNSVRDFPLVNQPMAGYPYSNLREATDGRRIIDAEMLNGHLGALRSEIKLLHNDVTALKMTRSFSVQTDRTANNTSRTFGNSTSRTRADDSSLTPTRQTRPGDSGMGNTGGSDVNTIPGPLSHTSFPRYPSRYSPQFVYTGQYPDTGRSVSRADSVAKSSRNKSHTDSSKPFTKSTDSSLNRSRSPDKKEENQYAQDIDNRSRAHDDDTFNSNKDNRYINFDEAQSDDRLFADDDRSDPNRRANEHLENDNKSNAQNDDIMSPVDKIESRMLHNQAFQRHADDNSSNVKPNTDKKINTDYTKDERSTEERAYSPSAPTSGDKERRPVRYPTRVPVIVTPDERHQSSFEPVSRHESTPRAVDNNQEPKLKKKVR